MPDDDELGSAPTVATDPQSTQSSLLGPSERPSAPPEMPAVVAERYEILGLLGVGGMGRVYRAHDRKLDEVVALKVLKRELVNTSGALERFVQEVKLARRVTSPHVIRTFDLGQHASEHFLTMEYFEGRSLANVIDDGVPTIEETVRIARGVAAGMAAAHATGVLHRDLKPDNVLVAKTGGRVAITDFGIARLGASPTVTSEQFIGTPAYMSPEQVEGRSDLGPAVDVYAFGAILFELLTGRRPFEGGDMFSVALARLREPPPDPRTVRPVPDALAQLVLHCMAREPAGRFTDGSALAAALAALRDLTTSSAAPPPPSPVPGQSSRSVAILPLRASGDLAEVAEGLSEEIVDALSTTRALRVRPLASVRKTAGDDPREIGQALGVDVVVDGSLRKRGASIRLAARAIGVADGFQLWASHVDTNLDGVLDASDELVRAIANALVVDLVLPERASLDARIAERYLEAKAKLRAGWIEGRVKPAIEILEKVLPEAPDDPRIVATLAMSLARHGVYGETEALDRARVLAEKAVTLAPTSAEALLALALTHLYRAQLPEAARALRQAVGYGTGVAMAQGTLGALLLEVGHLEGALTHLEAAVSIDPAVAHINDLARAYAYSGRYDEALAMLRDTDAPEILAEMTIARLALWRGERRQIAAPVPATFAPDFTKYVEALRRVHNSGTMTPAESSVMQAGLSIGNPRLRSARSQFAVEYAVYGGQHELALEMLQVGVDAGLADALWMRSCPLLAPIRTRDEFARLQTIVEGRARSVLDQFAPDGQLRERIAG